MDPKHMTTPDLIAALEQSQRQARELMQTAEMFRLISDNITDLIAVVDLDGKRLYNSSSYREILGDVEHLRGSDSFQEIHPDDRERIRKVFTESVRTGHSMRDEYRFLLSDGSVRYIESQGSVIRDDEGKPSRLLIVSRDITDRKMSEQKIHLLAQTVVSTKDCVTITDLQGTILFVNGAFLETYGYTEEELAGKHITMVRSPHAPEDVTRQIAPATLAGGWYGEVLNLRKDGSEFPIELWTSVVRNEDGEPVAMVSVGRDMTERKRSELIRRATYRIAEAAQSDQGTTEVLKTIHAIVSEIVPARNFYIALYDGETDLITFPYFEDECDPAPQPKRPGRGLTEYVLRSGMPLLATPERFEELVIEGEVEIIGAPSIDWLGVPLKVKENTIGVLVVQSYSDGVRFTERDKDMLMFVSSQIAVTVERQRSVEALRKSEARFRAVFERGGIGMAMMDMDGRILESNKVLQEMLGYTGEELRQLALETITHPDDYQAEARHMRDTLVARREDDIYRAEKRFVHKDGRILWGRLTSSLIWDSDGTPLFGIGMVENITEHKHAQEELYLEKTRFQQLFENTPLGIAMLDEHDRILQVNPAMEEIFQYTLPELFGRTINEILVLPEHAQEAEELSRQTQNGEEVACETIRRRKDGSLVEVRIYGVPIKVGGKSFGIYGIYEDISERRRAEAKLKEQAALLDIAHDAIAVRDLNGTIIFWNMGAEQLYGWQASDILGKNVEILFKTEDLPSLNEALHDVLMKGNWSGELRQRRSDGRDAIVQSRWSLVHDAEGKPASILDVATDITDKKQLEARYHHAQRLEIMGTLAGGIAHDLNNVLTPVAMSIELLQSRTADDKTLRLLSTIDMSVKRGADIVKQVLTFARGVEGERVALQPKHLLREMEKIMESTFPKNIDIRSDVAKSLWTAQGDATQLHQVLMNLCVNARDAMPRGGVLELHAANVTLDEEGARIHPHAHPGTYVLLSVADTGTGIPDDVIEKIFDPFFTTKEVGKGTGLGLSTVLGIVDSHGGFITVASEVGKGTEFRVYIPSGGTAVQAVARSEIQRLPTGHGELILVVDDETSIREMTKDMLETFGYQVLAAKDGMEAILHYDRHRAEINLVVTDMMMPNMDGGAVIRVLKRINPDVRIVAVSGLAEGEGMMDAEKDVVRAFLSKPYRAEELLKTIEQALR
jgi:PAS domain S-box-containing protein